MNMLRTSLSLALLAALAAPVLATDGVVEGDTSSPAASTRAAKTLETVSVVGQSATRQVQQLDKQQIDNATPGTSPIQMLQTLPGVNFVSNDPFGTDEWSSRISLRGFNHTQLGYTLDGIPLGNTDYHSGDGLSVTRAWISENLGDLELSQGSGGLGTASTSNLGGTVQLHTDDPAMTPGVRVNATGGSYGFKRGFIRADTGDIGGFSGYLSGMYVDAPKWKGEDSQRQRQINAKALYNWTGGRITALVDVSRRVEQPYLDLSKDSLKRCGYNFDYLAPDWQRAVDIANGKYSGCVTSADDTYYAGNGIRHDELASVKGEFFLNDRLTLTVQPYYHHDLGQGHWFAPASDLPYTPAPGDEPIALRLSHYLMNRGGLTSSLALDLGDHRLEGGFWFEDSKYTIARSFQPIPAPGPISQDTIYDTYYNTLFRQRFTTLTRQWYLQDTWALMDDALHIDAGFKGHDVTTRAVALLPGRASGTLSAQSDFLPQIGANYRFGNGFESFASFTMNQNAFEPGAAGAWSSTQKTFDALAGSLHPERSSNSEIGLRYIDRTVQSSLALYNIDFKNRLLVIVPCAGVVSCPNQIANVGRVNSKGAEFTYVWQPTDAFRWFNSATYNDAKYRDNYLDAGALIATRGKTVVDSPKTMFASDVSYTFGEFRARLGAKYTGARYYTYVNDQRVPGFWLMDAGLSWERKNLGFAKSLKVSLTVSNLLDKKYIATIDSNGFTTSDPNGTFQTLLTGSPRQGFLSVDMTF
ncbi:iron complex outermembrane receptor protein [Luteibacter rhizovicinus]|uniref:Iron complex outermembrane receptor protein n=1 Tax=Luteibacter rhizovicinus TaxID=242606 RepID=A0A4R3YUF0_9GAMM|nr:TonB-dependent receptor [Luteibacter rhizovicinus]TCV96036.1 iron complex outermembrane receptor protein [Luteibacter rhizovicinus]